MTHVTRIVKAHLVASFLCAFAISGATFAGVLLARAPAALAAYTDCPSATFCMWHDSEYSGTRWGYTNNNSGTDHWHLLYGSPAYDNASSLIDMRDNIVYIDGGYGSVCIGVGPNYRRANLANWCWPNTECAVTENDSITEIYLVYSGTSC
jgi:hypothetical protein